MRNFGFRFANFQNGNQKTLVIVDKLRNRRGNYKNHNENETFNCGKKSSSNFKENSESFFQKKL